jgi:phage tail-like protein
MPGMEGGTPRSGPGKEDPLVQAHYYVTFEPHIVDMVFRECSGIGSESEVIEYKGSTKDDYHTIQAIPGRLKWNKVSLKRGITSSMAAWAWRKMIEEGKVEQARANGSIVMVNQEGQEVARWNFFRAWPSKVVGPTFNSSTNEVGIEELEIVHEKMIRVK